MLGLIWLDISEQYADKPLSTYQISLLAILVFISIFLVCLLGLLWKNQTLASGMIENIQSFMSKKGNWGWVLIINNLVFLVSIYLITLSTNINEPFAAGILSKTRLIHFYIVGITVTINALLLISYAHIKSTASLLLNSAFFITLGFSIIIIIGWFWVVNNNLEQVSQITGWNPLGAPVLETQVFFAWLIGTLILLLSSLFSRNTASSRCRKAISNWKFDLLVIVLLWGAAIILWQTTPIAPNWFLSEKRAPNFEYYPNSDAVIYDTTAQDQLVGEGFRVLGAPYVRRPLQALMLSLIHAWGGQDYDNYIVYQVIILALIPPLFYLLARLLHNRVSGIIIALLILFREKNSIALAGNITTSNAKVLLSDMLTFLTVMIFVIAATYWVKRIAKPGLAPLLAGGALGLPILIRPETGSYAFILFIIIGIGLFSQKNFKLFLQSSLLFTLGLGCILTPWIVRNYLKTGSIYIDSPYFLYEIIEQRYINPEKNTLPSTETGKSETELYKSEARDNSPSFELTANSVSNTITALATPSPEEEYIETVKQKTWVLLKDNPSEIIRFSISHYLNSQLQTFLVLPNTIRPVESLISLVGHKDLERFSKECCSAIGYIRRLPYWRKWNGNIPSDAFFLLTLNIIIFSFGVNVAWQRYRWAGLFPIFVSFMHFWVNAFFRNSGGRYILPIDWIGIFYYGIGLTSLTANMINLIQDRISHYPLKTPENTCSFAERIPKSGKILMSIVLLSGLGLFLPLYEMNPSQQYSDTTRLQMLDTLLDSPSLDPDEKQTLLDFLASGGDVLLGRALYPRYYPKDLGEPGSTNPFMPRNFSRVSFYLAGPKSEFIIIPKLEKIKNFPNASDVLVFTCPEPDPLAVALFESNSVQQIIWRSPLPDQLVCPLEPIHLPFELDN